MTDLDSLIDDARRWEMGSYTDALEMGSYADALETLRAERDSWVEHWLRMRAERDAALAREAALMEIVDIVRARRQRFADKWHPPNHPRNEEEERLDALLGIQDAAEPEA